MDLNFDEAPFSISFHLGFPETSSLLFSAGGGVRAAVHPGLQQRPEEDVRHTQTSGEDQALLQR